MANGCRPPDNLLQNIETISQPLPRSSKRLTPTEFSASRHQRLIDCPYKFFASDVLGLKALEQISLELMKSARPLWRNTHR